MSDNQEQSSTSIEDLTLDETESADVKGGNPVASMMFKRCDLKGDVE